MKADPPRTKMRRNYPELPWKSTTCVAKGLRPQITTKRAFDKFQPLGCRFPISQVFKEQALAALSTSRLYHHYLGMQTLYYYWEGTAIPQEISEEKKSVGLVG
jgi:hypothetical protein